MIYIWLGIMVFALCVEAAGPALVSIWFSVGAFAAMICAVLGAHIAVQIAVFAIVSAAFLSLYIFKFKGKSKAKNEPTNIDALIGTSCKVTETIPSDGVGRVNAGSVGWAAVSADGEELPVGTAVVVVGIEGVKLKCSRKQA